MDDTGRLVVTLLLASFAIERVVASVDFFLNKDTLSEKKRKLILFGISALIGIAVVVVAHIRVLAKLKFEAPNFVDILLTWMILVGGADKLGSILTASRGGGSGSAGAAGSAPPREIPPIKIIVDHEEVTVSGLQQPR